MPKASDSCPTCYPISNLVCRANYTGASEFEITFASYWNYIQSGSFHDGETGSLSTNGIYPTNALIPSIEYVGGSSSFACFNLNEISPDVEFGGSHGVWRLPQPACVPGCGGGGDGAVTISLGQVFITNVASAGVVGSKLYVPDTVPLNYVLYECTSDSDACTIHFIAEGGITYSPTITTESGTVECNDLQQFADDKRLFYGTLNVSVPYTKTFTVLSDTNQFTTVKINRAAAPPIINRVEFTGGYPGSQTEVKAGDTYDVQIYFDLSAGSNPDSISIENWGCTTGGSFPVVWELLGVARVTITIKATGNTATPYGVAVKGANAFGSWGSVVYSTAGGAVDGTHTVLCCDLAPSFVDNGVTYPMGQSALKDTETAQQSTTVNNASSAVYSCVTGDLTITDPNVLETVKTVTCTNPGTYNDSSPNFRIVATRNANAKSASFNKVIEIADVAPVVTVTQPQARLRSSVSGSNYSITATANQKLAAAPEISIPVSGTWQGTSFTGGPKVWTRLININDSAAKGTAPWGWSLTPAKNRAGLNASITGNEVVGGFTSRTLTIAAWPNREAVIGTSVSDTSKLSCENLSKGGDGPNGGTMFTFQSSINNALNTFTITTPSGVYNASGSIWYNCDQANAVSNTAGTAQVIIEEVV